jgi:probable blue pigment (indigoidine) exporter
MVISMEAITTSPAADRSTRWALLAAVAPIAWGTTYFVTREFLPGEYPLYGALIRALPAGLLLLVVVRRLPRGSWWWRSVVLGTLNMGAFFVLVYLAAQLLPTSIASTVMAAAPIVMMLLAWVLLNARPRAVQLAAAAIGILGVGLLLLTGTQAADAGGVVASVAALVMSSLGYVLAKRWSTDVDPVSLTAWQLVAAGLILAPVAATLEGAPPRVDATTLLAYGYVSIVGTAVAFVAWFTGLRHLGAGTVGLVGLLNPVTGVILGTLVVGELLSVRQILGVVVILAAVTLGQPGFSRAFERMRAWMKP